MIKLFTQSELLGHCYFAVSFKMNWAVCMHNYTIHCSMEIRILIKDLTERPRSKEQ